MDTRLLEKAEKKYIRKDLPDFNVGDTIAVDTIIREAGKTRTQTFEGIILAQKGSGSRETFTIRKISYGVGVEKIIPLHSPNIKKIEVKKRGKVRRSKLYYMRKRIGKRATKINENVSKKAKA
ncbi:50S ribosomal protein L19 [Candidatus Dojkabacteria bacterium]|nr:50S ribosomal protein L19 [Candidatus Dojkabacteria bacterium]